MARSAKSTLPIMPAILALAVLLAFGYMLFTDLEPSRTEHTVNPPIEIIERQQPLTVIEQPTDVVSEDITQQEANAFIAGLAQQNSQAITIEEKQDQFVRHDSTIILPNLEHRITSIEELLADPNLTTDTPLVLHYTTQSEQQSTLAQLSDQYDDHTTLITLLNDDGTKQTKPLFEFLNQDNVNINAPITVLTEQKHTLQITAKELSQLKQISPQQSVIATINHGSQELSVKDIIQSGEMPDNALFYLHRVTQHDKQGLWGIIQQGLIDKFREGVHIEGILPNKDSVQAIIPADADEKLSSGLSSFLGKILNQKVTSSYIYNFSTHTMTQDPNLIYPGQQLILIHFSPSELTEIYRFFSDKRNQGIQTFGIGN